MPLDLSFASVNWARAIRDRKHPGMLVKRHFEAMVFTYLAEELRTGDIAVAGASEFGAWSAHLLSYAECQPLIGEFCAEVGLPATAKEFTAALKERHAGAAAALDGGWGDVPVVGGAALFGGWGVRGWVFSGDRPAARGGRCRRRGRGRGGRWRRSGGGWRG